MQMPEMRDNTPCSISLHIAIMEHHYHAMQNNYVLEEALIIMCIYIFTHSCSRYVYNDWRYTHICIYLYRYIDMNVYVYKSKYIYILCAYISSFVCVYAYIDHISGKLLQTFGCICLPFSPLSLCVLSWCSNFMAHQKSSLLFTQSKLTI